MSFLLWSYWPWPTGLLPGAWPEKWTESLLASLGGRVAVVQRVALREATEHPPAELLSAARADDMLHPNISQPCGLALGGWVTWSPPWNGTELRPHIIIRTYATPGGKKKLEVKARRADGTEWREIHPLNEEGCRIAEAGAMKALNIPRGSYTIFTPPD